MTMTAEKKLNIYVNTTPTLMKWFQRLVGVVAMIVLPIGIGVYTDSTAMQWAGFTFGMLCILGFAISDVKRRTFTTYDDAIAFLQGEKSS